MIVRRGFTLIETLASLLVVSIGMAAAIGMFTYGLRLSVDAQARSSAMATAATVAADPTPMLDPDLVADWTVGSYDFDADSGSATTMGLINGFFVQRRESTTLADIIARSTVAPIRVYARSVHVEVDVYDDRGGRLLASHSLRYVRQRGAR